MRTDAGRLREPVSFERLGGTLDDYGNPSQSWATLGARYARIIERTGREQMDAGALQGQSPATIRVRHDSLTSTLRESDRVVMRGKRWNIHSVIQVDDHPRWLELLVQRGEAT